MRKAWAALSALVLSACAHHPRPAPKPISTAPSSTAPGAVRPLPGRICTQCGCRMPIDLHRQYCDERRHRYYYFDPGKKQYFWETGEPK